MKWSGYTIRAIVWAIFAVFFGVTGSDMTVAIVGVIVCSATADIIDEIRKGGKS